MKAVQYTKFGASPEVVDIDKPTPGPGQVLLKMTAAGLCHSDIFLMNLPESQYTFGPLPLTLGHEGVGTVAELGAGVDSVKIGQHVAVYGPWGCGVCRQCASGHENYCTRATELGIMAPGLGSPGAMAEYMVVDDARHLVDIGSMNPATTAPLTDAALTPYHSIRPSLWKLGAGSTAVVLGAGGLGHVGIQILRALSGARIIALDVDEAKLQLAKDSGADVTMLSSDSDVVARVAEMTGGRMAEGVFDFAGFQSSVDLARQLVGVGGDLRIVGLGMGGVTMPVGFFVTPFEATVGVTYWGYRQELYDVIELAREGKIHVHVENFSIDDAPLAYEKLHQGTLTGRAVVVF
ncbi:MAG TPA: NAD(P)-dependent alcohol dehydrogenase [Acidimicrobiales bacterium]|nr:NAD(P)-dependent alcohol dehydrogenase [Acidimicrobiales bacterium]